MKSLQIAATQGAIMLAMATLSATAQNWQVTNTFHVGCEGSWDYVTMDSHNHRSFVTRGTHTMAIDEKDGKVLRDIPGQNRSHGVALAPEIDRGFITDGGGTGAMSFHITRSAIGRSYQKRSKTVPIFKYGMM